MQNNRSVPVSTILPHLAYRDVPAAIDWLTKVFAFTEHYRYGDSDGAQMHLGDAWIMLSKVRPGRNSPAQLGAWSQSLTVFVEDVDAHYARSKSLGANIVEELHETIYGERQYGVDDPEGHHWLFSLHARDVNPEDWGARIAGR